MAVENVISEAAAEWPKKVCEIVPTDRVPFCCPRLLPGSGALDWISDFTSKYKTFTAKIDQIS